MEASAVSGPRKESAGSVSRIETFAVVASTWNIPARPLPSLPEINSDLLSGDQRTRSMCASFGESARTGPPASARKHSTLASWPKFSPGWRASHASITPSGDHAGGATASVMRESTVPSVDVITASNPPPRRP